MNMERHQALQDQQHHDIVAPHYDRLVVDSRKALNNRVFREIGRLLPQRASTLLDLGAGTGQFTVRFGSRFAEAVLVDHSERMLGQAGKNTQTLGIKLDLQHVDALEYMATTTKRFDVIAAIGFLHHLDTADLARLLAAVRRAL